MPIAITYAISTWLKFNRTHTSLMHIYLSITTTNATITAWLTINYSKPLPRVSSTSSIVSNIQNFLIITSRENIGSFQTYHQSINILFAKGKNSIYLSNINSLNSPGPPSSRDFGQIWLILLSTELSWVDNNVKNRFYISLSYYKSSLSHFTLVATCKKKKGSASPSACSVSTIKPSRDGQNKG